MRAAPAPRRWCSRVFQALRATDVNGGQTRRPTPVKDLLRNRRLRPRSSSNASSSRSGGGRSCCRRRVAALHDETLIDVSHEALLQPLDDAAEMD